MLTIVDYTFVLEMLNDTLTNFVPLWCRELPGSLFPKGTDVLPQDLMKSRNREIKV